MKMKRLLTLLTLTVLLLCSCVTQVDNSGAAYFKVEKGLNWKNTYQVGEALSLDGLTAKYFQNIESTDFEAVTLTKDMITGFDTSKAGSFTMTVTYKGKTDTVSYTVVPKATPFELIKAFCIGDNTVVSIDSTTMKASVLVFDNYFKAVANQPTKTEEKALSYLVNSKGKTCASFEYNGSRYDIFYEKESDRYSMLTVASGTDSSSSIEKLVYPIVLNALVLPQKNTVYKSEIKENIYYSIQIDDAYNAVVTKHEVNGDATVDTVMDSYVAADAVLTSNGLFKYSLHKDGATATATMSNQGQFRVRRDLDGVLESVYSVTCSPAA